MILVPILAAAAGCGGPTAVTSEPVTIGGRTMGTSYSVKLAALPEGIDAPTLKNEIDALLETVNDQMSTYRPESELSRFNTHEGIDWFDVSAETATVVAEALRIGELSGGAFDVTVGPLVNLWSFGPDKRPERIPTDAEIAAARQNVGRDKLAVRLDPPALRKSLPGVYVDLSAIAKGFGSDQVAGHLDRCGVDGYLVEIGGEMRVKGTKGDGSAWVVGIESPVENQRAVQKAIPLKDCALATSGDYRNYFEQQGQRYSHTIDPRSGRPIAHRLASVSVIADSCMTADALATALMVLGPEEAFDFAVEHKLAVLLIIRGDAGFIEKSTAAFEKAIRPDVSGQAYLREGACSSPD